MASSQRTVLSRRELYQRVWSKSISVVAKELGLSSNALAKICSRLLVPYPTRGDWNKISAGKPVVRDPLPAAPERQSEQVVVSAVPAASRRERTRLVPAKRREQLLTVAADIIRSEGLHAASLKRIAATAGISETQAYNYFPTRERLFGELAIEEFAKIQAARMADIRQVEGHHAKIMAGTRTYLRQIDQRGGLLQMLLVNPEAREAVQRSQARQGKASLKAHVHYLMELFGLPHDTALGVTVVLSRLCLRAGKLLADKRISLRSAEQLCLAIVSEGSRTVIGAETIVDAGAIDRRPQRAKAA
jgi:AcrR family transcriptional regulator